MQLVIESLHIEPGDELTNLIRRKIEHLGKRYERIDHCNVVLKKDKDDAQKSFFIEIKMGVPGTILFASDKADSFEKALSNVINDLEHQLTGFKEVMDEKR